MCDASLVLFVFENKSPGQLTFVDIETEHPLSVKYFQPSVKGEYHRLNDTVYEILPEDLGKKISAPKIKNSGKFRQFYKFE